MTVTEAIRDFLGRLESLAIPYAVGGSYASSAWGKPRQTHDLDLNLLLQHEQVPRFVAAFEDDFLLHIPEIESAITSGEPLSSFQLLHMETTFKIDAFPLRAEPFDDALLLRRARWELLPGMSAWLQSPEDVLIQKLRWFELGNRVSDRQWNDIVQVVEIQRERLDLKYLNDWTEHFNLGELWLLALEQGS